MKKIIESIPNFSEGRDLNIINKIRDAFLSIKGLKVLDYSTDYDHNRSVFTILGSKKAVCKGLIKATGIAVKYIDLNKHQGQHPRIGAIDVIPLVPLANVSMDECIKLSKKLASAIYRKYQLPSFLYEESQSLDYRKNLADIRKGNFEGLEEKIADNKWIPDYGKEIHKSGGALVIGARRPLIAYNILLNTNRIEIAKDIASKIRERTGGLKCVKALGLYLETKGLAQVSINLTNYRETSIFQVFNAVREEADKYGISIVSSELIGLAPARAFADSLAEYIKLENYSYDKIIENHLFSLEI